MKTKTHDTILLRLPDDRRFLLVLPSPLSAEDKAYIKKWVDLIVEPEQMQREPAEGEETTR